MRRLRLFAGDIKIHHTVFALPWAILSAALAGRTFPGSLTLGKIALILVCMVTARTVAMSANRLIDADLDAKNPRTARRAVPSGLLSRRFVLAILAICCCGFVAATAGFEILYRNIWPLAFSLPVLAYLCGYPFMKRFTRLCHYYLGIALALAPVCAWVAVTGRMDWPPMAMFVIVAAWTAGFDIIYACQDYSSDVQCGVYSVPARIGVSRALWVSRLTHLLAAVMLIVLGRIVPQFGILYDIGAALAILLLIVEQSLVKPNDLSKVNLSFFTINGAISVLLATLGILDLIR
ncbi:MAG TPA: 4-hydroxybenzoate octaprenyltransferase [Tepidisphaeraceae bacterium]|nr:4-hydroxybenzoate octaprenyltransferase [Tepidisphaeraceae bacterium]